MKDFKIY